MISREKLLELYTALVKCRLICRDLAPSSLQVGCHEATYAGMALDLLPTDTLHTSASCVLPALVHRNLRRRPGAAFKKLVADKTRRAAADLLAKACEVARAHKVAKKRSIAMTFCGDAEVSLAQWKKALKLTSLRGLPMVFVSVRRTGEAPAFLGTETIAPEGMAFGVPLITVDGDDAVAVYRVAYESIVRARQFCIPTLIDSVSNPSANSIAAMETYLDTRGYFGPALKLQIEKDLRAQLSAASFLPE